MPKVVVNGCYGGFGISNAAIVRYAEIKGIELVLVPRTRYGDNEWQYHSEHWERVGVEDEDDRYFSYYDIDRTDPALVQVVEELGNAANGDYAELRIVDIPDDVNWYIDEYDGIETVREHHRTW
jgi:hypothetical protein